MTSEKKKILFVHHGSGMGGAPQLLLELLERLDREKYEPAVWCIRKSSASELFASRGYRVIIDERAIPFLHISDGFYGLTKPHLVWRMSFGQIKSYRTAKEIFARENPDFIHINTIVLPGVLLAAHQTGKKVIVNVLEVLSKGYTGFRRMLVRHYTKRWGNAFVFMLPSEDRRWRLKEGTPATDVFDFINVSAYRATVPSPVFRKELGVNDETPLIGYFGRFTKAKGIHKLLLAVKILKERGVPFHLALVGPAAPPQQYSFWRRLFHKISWSDYIRELVAKYNLKEQVTFYGEATEVMPLVAACDVLAVPFLEPHFSRLIAEASSAGKPAVSFAIDGPGEEIINEKTGLTVEPFSPLALANALERLIKDKTFRENCGKAAGLLAPELFDAENNARKVFSLYTQLGL